ncbi:MAG: SLC13/DASS family transporter [bacterium]|nr:MAG: SLC13/DASS family transporter [bacterium]
MFSFFRNNFPPKIGFWVGLLVLFITQLIPATAEFSVEQKRMLAITLLMAIWWMTEALPLGITALLPLILYPLFGIMKSSAVAPHYMDHLVFLFLGGFLIAIALQEWQLHRRFALFILSVLGINHRNIVLAFMFVSASLSMWISNTATAIMMLPIAVAVIRQMEEKLENHSLFASVILLGIAYSCSIGGIATLIGTPPNIIFSGIFQKFFPENPTISFVHWMTYMLPLSLILFFVIWGYLSFIILRKRDLPQLQSREYFRNQYKALGDLSVPQKRVLGIFLSTAVLWIFRSDIQTGFATIPGWPRIFNLQNQIQDSTIAIGMAVLLFIVQVSQNSGKRGLLQLKNLFEVPWDILLLFGGGFALASGIQETGLGAVLGQQLEFLGQLPSWLMLFLLTLTITFLTELTSNTAVATTILPVAAALSIQLGTDPMLIMLPVTIASSCAFMLPVATPPNAIIFGSRYVPISRMVTIGFALNLLVAVCISVYFYFLLA